MTKVEVEARGPRLMELIGAGSEAEGITSVLTLKGLQDKDGAQKVYDALDTAFPDQPQPQKLAQA